MAVYLFAQFARSYSQFTGQKTTKFEEVCDQAAHTVTMGPMLCILFLGARMRTLQMILVPLVVNGEASFDDKGLGDFEYEVKHKMLGNALTILWLP